MAYLRNLYWGLEVRRGRTGSTLLEVTWVCGITWLDGLSGAPCVQYVAKGTGLAQFSYAGRASMSPTMYVSMGPRTS